jgi:nucleotide-binding universal stress UspA family protein
MGFKRILVPADGSKTSAKGLAMAIRLAKENRAKLLLMHVVEEYAAFATPEAGLAVGPILDAIREGGQRTLKRVTQAARRAGAHPQTALVEDFGGRVADAIVGKAKRWKADLIVMGTHGRRGLNRALMGSDAELVVRWSPVPVLLVPAAGRRRR